jgi:Sulfatase
MLFTARVAAAAVALIVIAAYYLLASIPFSYYHFLQVPQLPWLPTFVLLHPLLFAAALAAIVPRPRLVSPALRPWIRYVALAGATTTVCMAAIEAIPVLQSFEVAAALAFVPLLLLTAAAALNIAAARADAGSAGIAVLFDGAPIARAALAGFLVGAAYVAAGAERGAAATLGRAELAAAAAISVAAHVACFSAAALALALVRRLSRRRPGIEPLAIAACAAVAGAVVIRRSLLTALILSDVRAASMAAALALAIAAAVWAARANGDRSRAVVVRRARWRTAAPLIVVLTLLVAVLPPMLLLADWGGSLQKMMALAAWAAAVAFVADARVRDRRQAVLAAALCVAAFTAASTVVIASRGGVPSARADGPPRLDLGVVLDRYATFDPSFTVLLDVFRPVVSDNDFYRTVRAAGDATDDRSLGAVPLSLADVTRRPLARPPNIFIVVVDSLRPDYVSAYNPAATFTPAIGAFASERDTIVMRRAFTQYAGTALSQPAIWAGGLIQRAMYVKPFAAINNLERLTVAAGYRRYISIDPPLSAILEDWSNLVRLDAHLTHPERRDEAFKFDLCGTVPDLIGHLDRDPSDRPVFFYSQPQNIHIRVLAGDSYPRDERVTIGGRPFFKPAVGAISRIDGCFGRLVDDLKARGLYDDSIVVLTSDHGDSYGEAGRWAHAFYMAPETLRIPLIVHVPRKYLAGRTWDPDALALLTDVTPTLYDLAGYPPAPGGEIAGRSLFARAGSVVKPRDMVLVQSSYSRVYGLLDGGARWMYVADANHDREEFYDLRILDPAVSPFPKPVASADRPKYRQWLLDRMGRLNAFYVHRP